jgi:hypothetical protein
MHEEMVVVGHERVGMDLKLEPPDHLANSAKEPQAVVVAAKDRCVSCAAVHDVMPCAGIVDAGFASHRAALLKM